MGYGVRVTRAPQWSMNQGAQITAQEWLELVARTPWLIHTPANGEHVAVWHDAWFEWRDGNIYTESPDELTLRKMLEVAKALGGIVQGEDGEPYTAENIGHAPFMEWIGNVFQDAGKRPPTLRKPAAPSFAIGDRVRDVYGQVAEVIAMDVGAQHGLGEITIAYEDGTLRKFQYVAHGLERVGSPK
jgi:hypothetical protein